MTGFKPILCQMKFIMVRFDCYTSSLTTMACERVNMDFQQGLGDQY